MPSPKPEEQEREYLRELPRHLREHIASFQDRGSRETMRKVLKMWRATGEGLYFIQLDKIRNEIDKLFKEYLPKDPYALPSYLTTPAVDGLNEYAKYMRQYEYGYPAYGTKPVLEDLRKALSEVESELATMCDKSIKLKKASPEERGHTVVSDLSSYYNFKNLPDFLRKLSTHPAVARRPDPLDYFKFMEHNIYPSHTVNGPFMFDQFKTAIKAYGSVALKKTDYNKFRDLFKSFTYTKSPASDDSQEYEFIIESVMEDAEIESHVRARLSEIGVKLPAATSSGGRRNKGK